MPLPGEVANLMAFLASDAAKEINGAIVPIDRAGGGDCMKCSGHMHSRIMHSRSLTQWTDSVEAVELILVLRAYPPCHMFAGLTYSLTCSLISPPNDIPCSNSLTSQLTNERVSCSTHPEMLSVAGSTAEGPVASVDFVYKY